MIESDRGQFAFNSFVVMMRFIISISFILLLTEGNAQKIMWHDSVSITLENYKSPSTEINDSLTVFSIGSGAQIDLSFAMTTYEFALTKNFNSKIKTTFDENAAYIVAPNEEIVNDLLKFGKYQFDLNELYARRLRKALYDNKGILSGMEFFRPMYDSLLGAMNNEFATISKNSSLGTKREILADAHADVLSEIAALSDFCIECTPPKKRKKRK